MLSHVIKFIRRKLAWELGISIAAVMLIVCMLGSFFINYAVTNSFEHQLIERAKLAGHSIQFAAESSSSLGGIQRFVAAMGAENEFDFIAILAGEPLRVISSTELNAVGQPLNIKFSTRDQELVKTVNDYKTTENQFYSDNNKNVLRYIMPVNITGVLNGSKPIGNAVLYLRINTDQHVDDLKNLSLVMNVFLVLISGIIFFVIVVLFTVRVNHPQLKILEVLNQRKLGKKAMCVVKGDNEITTLSETFNELFESLDEVEKLKSEFVSTVSHELRTPLTAIRGSLGVVLGAFGDKIPDQASSLVGMASRNCEQLTLLINDLLDLEKMASGNLQFDFVETDLAVQLLQAKACNDGYGERHGVEIIIKSTLENAFVMADIHRLQQVFANLLSNAIKFSERNTSVIMTLTEAGNMYRIGVINKGRGIPEKFKKRIFQRFAQADSSDAREKGGTGLGLSIVKLIIEHHQGTIDFISEENKQTEFFFFIPKLVSSPQNK